MLSSLKISTYIWDMIKDDKSISTLLSFKYKNFDDETFQYIDPWVKFLHSIDKLIGSSTIVEDIYNTDVPNIESLPLVISDQAILRIKRAIIYSLFTLKCLDSLVEKWMGEDFHPNVYFDEAVPQTTDLVTSELTFASKENPMSQIICNIELVHFDELLLNDFPSLLQLPLHINIAAWDSDKSRISADCDYDATLLTLKNTLMEGLTEAATS